MMAPSRTIEPLFIALATAELLSACSGEDDGSQTSPVQPDVRFHEELVRFSARAGATLVTPFWTNYYFAYVDHDATTRDQPYAELVRRVAPGLVANAVVQDRVTVLGSRYADLIAARGAR